MVRKRIAHLDLLECIAIFFVISYHGGLYYFDIANSNAVSTYIGYFFKTILSTCVPLFFFVNGYLLLNHPFSIRQHYKKIIRMIPLVFIWAMIHMAVYMRIESVSFSLKSAIYCFLDLNIAWGMNLFWFIGALICIYIFFPAIKALFDTNKPAFYAFSLSLALLTFGQTLINQLLTVICICLHSSVWSIDYPAIEMFNPLRGVYGYSFVYFCFGGIVSLQEEKLLAISPMKRNTYASFGIVVSCFLLFVYGIFCTKIVNKSLWDVVWNGYDSVSTACNVFFLYILSLNYKKSRRLITLLSCNTLGIYFIHEIAIRLTKPAFLLFPCSASVPFSVLYSALILAFCFGICLIFKRIPFIRMLF